MVTETKTINCETEVLQVRDELIVRLPEEASLKLPSRGQVAVAGTINGAQFEAVIEPDGMKGHWLAIRDDLRENTHLTVGSTITLELQVAKEWPEPLVPADLERALKKAPDILETWHDITPMARWEWVRWINETRNKDTRARRVEVTISKMRNGKRRPCCFNLAACTDPLLAKSGKLALV